MTDAIIFDIDGTLADVSHRRHHVTGGKKEWNQFFDKMVDDPPLANVCLLADILGHYVDMLEPHNELKLFLFSGRPDSHRQHTEEWLERYVPQYFYNAEALLMRAEGDYRPDTEVKKEFLHNIQAQGYEVRFVVDDRPSVIQMWKDEGLTVLEHDSGEWGLVSPAWVPGQLHMMVGPSGAGKTTYINMLPTMKVKHPGVVISSDNLREEITGTIEDQSANDQVFSALHALTKARIKNGLNTVVDATNLRSRDRRALRDLCPADTEIVYHVIDRPLEDKHRDAGWRDSVVIKGVKLIDKHHQSFQSGIKYILRGDDDPRVTVLDRRIK